MKMHKRKHSYIRTKLPRASNTCADDSNSQVPLYVTYLNKYAVTKFNKYRFPQYPVGFFHTQFDLICFQTQIRVDECALCGSHIVRQVCSNSVHNCLDWSL